MIHLNVGETGYRISDSIHNVLFAFHRGVPIEALDADDNKVFVNPAQISVIREVEDDDDDED